MRGLVVASLLLLLVGCAPGPKGPHRITGGYRAETCYARLTPKSQAIKIDWSGSEPPKTVLTFVDEVTGQEQVMEKGGYGFQTYEVTPLDEETYVREVAEAALMKRRQKEAEYQARQEVWRERNLALENRVRYKDWQGWYEAYRALGRDDDEAARKANQIIRHIYETP